MRADEKVRPGNEAAVLLIRGAVNHILGSKAGADDMLREQQALAYDDKHYSAWAGVQNSKSRKNIVFGNEHCKRSDDWKQGTWSEVPLFSRLRAKLPSFFGSKTVELNGEGNLYENPKLCGIPYHGDRERKIVVGISLGNTATLRFYWRAPQSESPCSTPFDFKVKHGDIYVMSEKATGWDVWNKRNYRLVHAAGGDSFIKVV